MPPCPVDTPLLDSSSALMLATQHGHTRMATLLLDSGAHVNHVNVLGDTPLMQALSHDRVEIVRMLLARGADVNGPRVSSFISDNIARWSTSPMPGRREMAKLIARSAAQATSPLLTHRSDQPRIMNASTNLPTPNS